jgi:two-component system, LytTR family, response regulator
MMRILVVDSDSISRRKVVDLLSRLSVERVIEECDSGLEAIPVLHEFKPDILICEVDAPGLDGFSLLETVPQMDRPATIFISNHNYFAARAFDVSAADYILRPVREERFHQALERARSQAGRSLASPNSSGRNPKRFAIKSGRSVILVEPEELDWADAEGKYVRLHLRKEILLLKMSISALEQELDPVQFVRIHRSTIVNIDRIRAIQPWSHRRTYQVTLHDGTRLVLSRKTKLRAGNGKTISSFNEAASLL